MKYTTLIPLLATGALALPQAQTDDATAKRKNFFTSNVTHFDLEHAHCVGGYYPITFEAVTTKITIPEPADQPVATQILVDLLQADPNPYLAKTTAGNTTIRGTYNLYGQLCVPKTNSKPGTLQILSHGDTLSLNYWNLAPNQSYVDFMTSNGYATLAYDRLGIGLSDHPDAINVVQYTVHVAILHRMVQALRNNKYADVPTSLKKFVGVGHSAGSTATSDLTSQYAKDFDGVILQGLSAEQQYIIYTDAALLLSIGAKFQRNGQTLSNGYLQPAIAEGTQFSFYSYPNYPMSIFDMQFQTRQTNTVGELFTYGNIVAAAPGYTGPVDSVLGQNDAIFCGSNCYYPTNQAVAFLQQYYPNSKGSDTFIAPGSGHVINCHYSAQDSWKHNLQFLKKNNL